MSFVFPFDSLPFLRYVPLWPIPLGQGNHSIFGPWKLSNDSDDLYESNWSALKTPLQRYLPNANRSNFYVLGIWSSTPIRCHIVASDLQSTVPASLPLPAFPKREYIGHRKRIKNRDCGPGFGVDIPTLPYALISPAFRCIISHLLGSPLIIFPSLIVQFTLPDCWLLTTDSTLLMAWVPRKYSIPQQHGLKCSFKDVFELFSRACLCSQK